MMLIHSHQWTGHSLGFLCPPILQAKASVAQEMDVSTSLCVPGSDDVCFYKSLLQCINTSLWALPMYIHWGLWLYSMLEELKGSVSESICACFFIWAFEWIWIFVCEQHLFNFQSNWGHAILKLNIKNREIVSCLGTSILPVVDGQCNDNWVF